MNIYRYISFEDFVRIINLNEDYLTNPIKWKDSYEGYLLRYMDSDNGRERLIDSMYDYLAPRNYCATINNFFKLLHARWWVYGKCWTTQQESELMWRANSYGNHSLRIQTTSEDVLEIIAAFFDDAYNVKHGIVEYDLNGTDDEKLKLQIDKMHISYAVTEPYFHKADAYKSESEYRFIVQDNRYFMVEELSMNGANFEVMKSIRECNSKEEILKVVNQSINKFLYDWKEDKIVTDTLRFDIKKEYLLRYIQSVTVHPDAEQWYVDLINKLCKKYNIEFCGQSELYSKISI